MNDVLERIERHAGELRDDECWETDYAVNTQGYVQVRSGDSRPQLHRLAYEAYYAEPIPEGLIVCHTCDNPRCFNPQHMFLGTYQDNVLDQIAKGRRTQAGGWHNVRETLRGAD